MFSLKAQDLDKQNRPWAFWRQKTWLLWNTPRFWHVLILRFRYDVSPISLYSLKVPRFWQAKVGHGFFGVKNMVFMKYPKILTGVLLDIVIKCRPKIVVFFKNPKILTRKIGHEFFGGKKYGSYEIPQDFDRCFTWNFDTM